MHHNFKVLVEEANMKNCNGISIEFFNGRILGIPTDGKIETGKAMVPFLILLEMRECFRYTLTTSNVGLDA